MRSLMLGMVLTVGLCPGPGCRQQPLEPPLDLPSTHPAKAKAAATTWVVLDEPVGGIVAYRVDSGERRVVVASDRRRPALHSLSGPDRSGRIAYVENYMSADFHRVKTVAFDGSREQLVEHREGDALWQSAIGDYLGLSPRGHHLAAIGDIKKTRRDSTTDAILQMGKLLIWDLAEGERQSDEHDALDGPLSWSRDGNQLCFIGINGKGNGRQLLREYGVDSAAYAEELLTWWIVPIACLFDRETGKTSFVCPAEEAFLSLDGEYLLVSDHRGRHQLLNLRWKSSRTLDLAGARPIQLISSDRLLVLGPVDPTSVPVFTKNNSPFVGPKRMLPLATLDLKTRQSRVILEYVDPRRNISLGHFGVFE